MLARWIATVAALLLACAQAGAHVRTESVVSVADLADVTAPLGELAQPSKTACPARANLEELAPGENPPVTHCHLWQKSFSAEKSTSGTTIWRWDSAPFGDTAANEQPTAGLPAFPLNLRFPGQQYDRETGTHYNYFRDYEAQTGRYVQSDPVGLSDGPNPFLYTHESPLLLIDPLGLNILNLRYKPGWTPAQRAEADEKLKKLNEHCKAGRAVVTAPTRGASASRRWARAGNTRRDNEDVDHELDLQLGGCDCLSNMSTLNNSVNRSLGPQIRNDIRRQGLQVGDMVTRIDIR